MKRKKTTKRGQTAQGRKVDIRLPKGRKRRTQQETTAHETAAGLAANAIALWQWSRIPFGDPERSNDLSHVFSDIILACEAVNRGDLAGPEAVLVAQGLTLNAVFSTVLEQARQNANLNTYERLLRLAFRAQSQCRATFESLAALKNPLVFAKQANIAGQQVVNNGTMIAPSRAREVQSRPNELLEVNAERLDEGTERETSHRHTAMAPLGTLDGASDGRGEAPILTERVQGQPEAHTAAPGATAEAARSGKRGRSLRFRSSAR